MDVRLAHVRHLEQFRCLFLHCQHNAFVLHIGRQVSVKIWNWRAVEKTTAAFVSFLSSLQILCHRAATGLSTHNDASSCVHHAAYGLAIAGAALVSAHLLGLVYDQRELEISQIKSACKLTPGRGACLGIFRFNFPALQNF